MSILEALFTQSGSPMWVVGTVPFLHPKVLAKYEGKESLTHHESVLSLGIWISVWISLQSISTRH